MVYTKKDVKFHRDNFGPVRPAVNVKVPFLNWHLDEIGASEDLAAFVFESIQEDFWYHLAPDWAKECLGDHVDIFAEGRSDGWLVVEGLDDPRYWNAIQLAKWRKFETGIRRIIQEITDWDCVKNEIENLLEHTQKGEK